MVRGVNCVVEVFLAATVFAVREHNQRFSAFFGLHQVVGGQEDCVVKLRAAAVAARLAATVVSAGLRAIGGIPLPFRWSHCVQLAVQVIAGAGKVLQQLDLAVEVDKEGRVTRSRTLGAGGQHQVNELPGRLLFVFHGRRNTAAGIDEEPQAKGQVTFVGKALDDLGTAIFSQREIGYCKVGH